METLIISDEFIGTDAFRTAIEEGLGADFGPVRAVEWTGVDDQHGAQHVMEVQGVEAVPAGQDVIDAVGDAEVIAVHFAPVTEAVLDAGKHLKAVVVARAGWENVNVEAATERGIAVVHLVGRNASAVAEEALGLALAELRDIARRDRGIREGRWPEQHSSPNYELGGKEVGVIGFGQIGRQLARRLSGFDVTLRAYDPYVEASLIEEYGGRKTEDLDEIFRTSDVIFLHARLSEETARFIGREQFALMKPTAYFINNARARMVDYDALYEALSEGRIAGAGLDVYEHEPVEADSRWRTLENVTRTPHTAGNTRDAWENSVTMVADAIGELRDGGKAVNTVNADALSARA